MGSTCYQMPVKILLRLIVDTFPNMIIKLEKNVSSEQIIFVR